MDAWIYDAVRTPRGKGSARGSLHGVRPVALVAQLLRALEARNALGKRVEDLLLGCVTQTGDQGADIARIAALYAGWDHVSGATVGRFCASGLSALGQAAARVACGMADLVVAGGVESTSRVPMFSDQGAWFADPEVAAATGFVHMGVSADLVATLEGLERPALEAYAAESQRLAARAREEAHFARSLVAVEGPDGEVLLAHDELVRPDTTPERLATLPVAFHGEREGDAVALARYPELREIRHVHTVGTSPALADGASALLVGTEAIGRELGLEPLARVLGVAHHAVEPVLMLTGNVGAAQRALKRAGLTPSDVDLWEINESFAAVMLHFMRHLDVARDVLNVDGGAIAMGHPLGATGGMLAATLIDALERRQARVGVVSICGGAGVATALVLERA